MAQVGLALLLLASYLVLIFISLTCLVIILSTPPHLRVGGFTIVTFLNHYDPVQIDVQLVTYMLSVIRDENNRYWVHASED